MTDSPSSVPAASGSRLAKAGLIAALLSRIFGRLVGILLVVLIARRAGDDTVAVYGYLLGTATLVSTLTDLGVASIAGREVAAGRLPARGAVWVAAGPQALSVLVAAVATVVLTVTIGPAGVPSAALWLTVAFVVITGFVGLWGELLRAAGRVYLEGALQASSALALVAGGVIVLQSGGDATDLLVVVAVKEAVLLAICVLLLPPQRHRGLRSRTLLKQSLWVAVAGTALVLLWRQGTIVSGTGSIGVLAAYVVASRYLDALITVAHTAGIGLIPGMSALAGDPAALRHTARRYLKLAVIVGVLVSVIGVLAARPLTLLPFGDRWESAVPAVRMIALSTLPILVAYVVWPVLLARHQVRLMAIACLAATLVGVPLSFLLFAHWSDAAAPAVGTTVGAAVLAGVMLWGVRDLFGRSVPEGAVPEGAVPGGSGTGSVPGGRDDDVEQSAGGVPDVEVLDHPAARPRSESAAAGGIVEQ